MIEKEFVPYEEALALKELGFNEPCHRGWDEDYKIWYHPDSSIVVDNPTFSQAFRWFRDKYGLKSWIQEHTADAFIYEIRPHKLTDYREGEVYVYEVYEEAELACLKKLIEIQGGNK